MAQREPSPAVQRWFAKWSQSRLFRWASVALFVLLVVNAAFSTYPWWYRLAQAAAALILLPTVVKALQAEFRRMRGAR